jgi:hypothetical protein
LDPPVGGWETAKDSAGREVVSASAMVVGAFSADLGASAVVRVVRVVRVAMAEHQVVLEATEATDGLEVCMCVALVVGSSF